MLIAPLSCLRAVCAAAETTYPRECCGLLVGRDQDSSSTRISRIVPARNLATRGHDRFELDPQLRFDLMRQLGDGPERLVGHYHSHPDGSASPSKTDLARAMEPDLIWLIVPVRRGRAGHPAAYALSENGDFFTRIPLRTEADDSNAKIYKE